MGYRNLSECVMDLEAAGRLRRLEVEVDANLEAGAIQRRVYQAGGPALLFTRVKGCSFPLLGNLFGTLERTRFLFRDTLESVQRLVAFESRPRGLAEKSPGLPGRSQGGGHLFPRRVRRGPILARTTTVEPPAAAQVLARRRRRLHHAAAGLLGKPVRPGFRHSNLGMYRVQISGRDYRDDARSACTTRSTAASAFTMPRPRTGERLRVNIFVGGPPAMTLAAVMPLPEGLTELSFAGLLGGRRMSMVRRGQPADAGGRRFLHRRNHRPRADPPEGPFGDHLGYYSLAHDFPVLRVEQVWHRQGAIWPFTTVGRPPQEDTIFGALIHELTGR